MRDSTSLPRGLALTKSRELGPSWEVEVAAVQKGGVSDEQCIISVSCELFQVCFLFFWCWYFICLMLRHLLKKHMGST